MNGELEYINKILKENETLKETNKYNQSIVDIFKKWIRNINGIEKINDTVDISSESIFYKNSRVLRTHKIEFPPLQYIEPMNDEILEKLLYASEIKNDCKVCELAKGHEFFGFKVNFCPICGKLL